MKEIVQFMSENVLRNTVFCITKCTQIPPVSMDYIYMAAINKHVSLLRSEVSVLGWGDYIDQAETHKDHPVNDVPAHLG